MTVLPAVFAEKKHLLPVRLCKGSVYNSRLCMLGLPPVLEMNLNEYHCLGAVEFTGGILT
jgi:hypothetical protein